MRRAICAFPLPKIAERARFANLASMFFPQQQRLPIRIELDDWLVLSIQTFDPDTQRNIGDKITRIELPPVQEFLFAEKETGHIKKALRQVADAQDIPTKRAKKIIDELFEYPAARQGLRALSPKLYGELSPLEAFLHQDDIQYAVYDAASCQHRLNAHLAEAESDLAARARDQKPSCGIDEHYQTTTSQIWQAKTRVAHPVAIAGQTDELAVEHPSHDGSQNDAPGMFSELEVCSIEDMNYVGASDHRDLITQVKKRKQHGDVLTLLSNKLKTQSDFQNVVVCHTRTQQARICELLRHADLEPQRIENVPVEFRAGLFVTCGELEYGFTHTPSRRSYICESEIFGKAHRRTKTRKRRGRATEAFLSDLSELAAGDYIVHVDHGIGKYLGIEKKALGQSAMQRMRSEDVQTIEVLVLEYAGGDRLLVPVTRLALIQKFAAQDTRTPKLDKLGGQTFAKKKARVKKKIQRLADELLVLYAQRTSASREPLSARDLSYAEFEALFPYDETPDQANAIDDVLADLESPQPMDRLVCGDVGFGKTEVAMRATFRVAMHGKQVAVLAPTTVLAQQHFRAFSERLADYPLRVEVLSRFVERTRQKEIATDIKEGKVDVVIGTHRLLSKDVHFSDLGLLVVDEEQRFGVTHKERIKSLKNKVDVLTLTATPIPRTLQMAVGGLRDLSVITTPPVDRRAVRTFACQWDAHLIKEAIERERSRGGQIFYVYNRIEGLYERADKLQKLLPNLRIAVAHGQMREKDLEQAMLDFVDGEFDLLCSTAIIESGLDIPRANTMIIDRADMFGLSQLYQLRGRIGRSKERAYCYLVTPPSAALNDEARQRIAALQRFTELGSGFQVASLDMQLRGMGELLGTEQSGHVSLVGFDMFVHMLEEAVAHLRGEEYEHPIDTELAFDLDLHLPADYIEDVGLRLSFYRRLGAALDQDAIDLVAQEMEQRFGAPPETALEFIRAMRLKPDLRTLRVLSCDATKKRVTLHLRNDTPLDAKKLADFTLEHAGQIRLTPDGKILKRFDEENDPIDNVRALLNMLLPVVS